MDPEVEEVDPEVEEVDPNEEVQAEEVQCVPGHPTEEDPVRTRTEEIHTRHLHPLPTSESEWATAETFVASTTRCSAGVSLRVVNPISSPRLGVRWIGVDPFQHPTTIFLEEEVLLGSSSSRCRRICSIEDQPDLASTAELLKWEAVEMSAVPDQWEDPISTDNPHMADHRKSLFQLRLIFRNEFSN